MGGEPPHGYSREQYQVLLDEFGITDAGPQAPLASLLRDISYQMWALPHIERRLGPSAQHRDRLLELAILAKRMRPLLLAEPLLDNLLLLPSPDSEDLGKERKVTEEFLGRLRHLEELAGHLARDQKALQGWRYERCFPDHVIRESAKSLPRRVIWEPVLKLWRAQGRRLGYSRDGPIMRVLATIHGACGIEPPRAESVRQTIRDLQKSPLLR